MTDGDSSSSGSTAIVAIVAIVVVLAVAYYVVQSTGLLNGTAAPTGINVHIDGATSSTK